MKPVTCQQIKNMDDVSIYDWSVLEVVSLAVLLAVFSHLIMFPFSLFITNSSFPPFGTLDLGIDFERLLTFGMT